MIIFAISIIFIGSLLGNIEKYWEECGVNGSKRTTPYPIIVPFTSRILMFNL
jgi:hypothetical protein